MKNSSTAVLIAVTLAFAAFIGGFCLGRNTTGQNIEISAFSATGTTASFNDHSSVQATASSSSDSLQSLPSSGADTTTLPPTEPVTFPININTATLEELDMIPEVGPVLAQRILDHREEIGGFRHIDELLDVKGIGNKTLDKIREYITL